VPTSVRRLHSPKGGQGPDTVAFVSASEPLLSRSAPAFGRTLARSDGSDLLPLRLHSQANQRSRISASPAFRQISRIAWRVLPGANPCFVTLFKHALSPPEVIGGTTVGMQPCLCAVAAIYLLGNCDSPGTETFPDYLTRFGAVSHRS
jgi:hypothetical protein